MCTKWFSFLFSTPEKHLLYDSSSFESKSKSEQIPEKKSNNEDVDNNTKDVQPQQIKYISGNLNTEDLYALPNKRNNKDMPDNNAAVTDNIDNNDQIGETENVGPRDGGVIGGGGGGGSGGNVDGGKKIRRNNLGEIVDEEDDNEEKGKQEEIEDKDANKDLPPGWEKHEGKLCLG